jgi:anti-sigma factor RsiW
MNDDSPELDGDTLQLVAYLDGELEADERRTVEERLGTDEVYRLEMQLLQGTWDALDQLPRHSAGENFAHTTVAMIALAGEQQQTESQADAPRRLRRQWLGGLIGMAAAAAIGFVAVSWSLPEENTQLVEDLPVLENLDALQQVGDLEFLQGLQEAGLFVEDEVTDESAT